MALSTSTWLERASHHLQQHRRVITMVAMTGLAGFGITAFGIAPLAPDAATLPQRWLTHEVPLQGLEDQVDALAAQELPLWRSDISRGSESAEGLLKRLGIVDTEAARFMRTDALARRLLQGRGRMLQARIDADGKLLELVARLAADSAEQSRTHFMRLTVMRIHGRLASRAETAELTTSTRMASGTVRSSMWAAADESRLPDAVATQLAEIFSTEIDFHREVHKGDTFSVVFETLLADGQPVVWNEGAGRVLAAEFINRGKSHHALWFDGGPGRGGYFGLDGRSKRRTFLASPLEFSRVTSGFANRFHPILQTWRQHLGVDYAAPTGTPVRSVGDGVVTFAGVQNGYGKVVEVQHGNERTTLYAHLSAIDVKKGDRVAQGQHVGAVGSTGWSTGPHLHFEFRVRGAHLDPLVVAKASEALTLDDAARPRFMAVAHSLQSKLDIAESLAGIPLRIE